MTESVLKSFIENAVYSRFVGSIFLKKFLENSVKTVAPNKCLCYNALTL